MGTENCRGFGFHDIKKEYRKRTEKLFIFVSHWPLSTTLKT